MLLTRAAERSSVLAGMIRDAGGRVVALPTVDIRPLPEPGALRKLADGTAGFDYLIFVSRNAVRFSLQYVPGLKELGEGACVLAVGAGSAEELRRARVKTVRFPDGNQGSEGLLALPELQTASVRGRSVLILRGKGGREKLGRQLRARGASVQYAELYTRQYPEIELAEVRKIWQKERPDAVVIHSGDGLRNLLRMMDAAGITDVLTTPLVVISPRLERLARDSGFTAELEVATGYTDEDIFRALKGLTGPIN